MKQKELAERIGVTREHLNAVIRGRVRSGGRLAVKLEKETGVPLRTWLTGSPQELQAAWSGLRKTPGAEAE